MDQQTKVADRNGAPDTESQGFARDVGSFASDVLTLTELQSQLLVADVRECGRRALMPSLVFLGGLVLGLACLPIALVTVALGLARLLETSYFMGFLIVAVGGTICSVLMCFIGCRQVRQHGAVLQRSWDELLRNLRWIKQVVANNRLK